MTPSERREAQARTDEAHAVMCDIMRVRRARVKMRAMASGVTSLMRDACGMGKQLKKVGWGSALSHACDPHGVCNANMRDQVGSVDPNTQGDTHETHTHTHTDDASTCKHDGCDG